jgi:HEAT repeat protein
MLAWPLIAGTARRPAPIPDERVVRRALTSNRGRLPLDVTLKTWAAFAGDEQEVGRLGWYDFFVRQNLGHKDALPALEQIAAAILDQSGAPLTHDKMKEITTTALTGSDGKTTANVDDVLGKLTGRSGLMIDWPGNQLGFVHPLVTGFVGSGALANADTDRLSAVASNPGWELAMPFAAARLPVDQAVTQCLGSTPDLLFSSLFSLVAWLPDAPPNAGWRTEIFRRLTAALLAPTQYPAIRERAMAALVASRDKNVGFILRQALRSTDPVVRRLGCVGLGALGEGEAIKDLGPMLADPDMDVQLAAGLALGAIGSEAALETMLAGFVDGDPALRQAVAEALAAIPGEGHAVLRDAMDSKEMMVRRAAVFGLARVKAAWALALLYRALLEDEQWYVRNAAEEAFLQVERPEEAGVTRHPEAEDLAWLIGWAAERGEGVPAGLGARQVLIRALQEGDPATRAAAARTLANLGYVPALKPLYGALRDKDEAVRAAVYEALSNLQNRLGEGLPAVV